MKLWFWFFLGSGYNIKPYSYVHLILSQMHHTLHTELSVFFSGDPEMSSNSSPLSKNVSLNIGLGINDALLRACFETLVLVLPRIWIQYETLLLPTSYTVTNAPHITYTCALETYIRNMYTVHITDFLTCYIYTYLHYIH